jgi:hypothetical protein
MQIEYDATRDALFRPEARDTLFEAGVNYSAQQLAAEAARLAYLRAESASADCARATEALARVEFGPPQCIFDSATETYAFLSKHATTGTTLLSFRGTQPDSAMNIATDLEVSTVPWTESSGRVHHGFAKAFRTVAPGIQKLLVRNNVRPSDLIVAGHSLGAALATLAASIWSPGWLVTFGSPRVGDADFAKTVASAHSIRFVDCCDVVTHVPPPLAGYIHINPFLYLTREARSLNSPGDSVVEEDRAGARREYFERYAWKLDTVAVRDLADHAPINYLRCLFNSPQSELSGTAPIGTYPVQP